MEKSKVQTKRKYLVLIFSYVLISCIFSTGKKKSDNLAPEFSQYNDTTILLNKEIKLTIHASGYSGDALVYTGIDLPISSTLNGDQFNWVPIETGSYTLKFIVSEKKEPDLQDTLAINIFVIHGLKFIKSTITSYGCYAGKSLILDSLNDKREHFHSGRDSAAAYLLRYANDSSYLIPTALENSIDMKSFAEIDSIVFNSNISELSKLNKPKTIHCVYGCPSLSGVFYYDSLFIQKSDATEIYSNNNCMNYDSLYLQEFNKIARLIGD